MDSCTSSTSVLNPQTVERSTSPIDPTLMTIQKKETVYRRVALWVENHKKPILFIITLLALSALTVGLDFVATPALCFSLLALRGALSLGAALLFKSAFESSSSSLGLSAGYSLKKESTGETFTLSLK